MKTAISIPDSLFAAVERLTKELGISRSAVFQRAVEAFMEKQDPANVTQSLNQVYGPDGKTDAKLDPLLDTLQANSLGSDPW